MQAQVSSNTISVQDALTDFSSAENTNIYKGSGIPTFSTKEQTKGSRYLFTDWVPGRLITTVGETINHSELLYNYDKISKGLLVTADKKIVIEVNKDNIQFFALKYDSAELQFEKVPRIDPLNFYQVIVKDTTKYSLYKQTKTVFIKSSYTTDGIFEYGNKYDEYVDNFTWYIVKKGSPDIISLPDLRAKTIKIALHAEAETVNKYFQQHRSETINEIFLSDLVNQLNQ